MNPADTLATLADIELPAPPDWWPLITLAAALLVVAGAILFRTATRRQTHSVAVAPASGDDSAREALGRLEQLQQEWASGALDAHAAAYRLATLLRLGLGLPQLHPAAPPTGLDTELWRNTLALLHELRYAPAPAQTLTPETFTRARHWLSTHEPGGAVRDV